MGHATARPRVLVADNDEEALTVTVLRLERAGYDVIVARDGEEALAQVQAEHPDLCIIDAMTPKLTGYDVMRRLREDATTSSMPVILLTALGPRAIDAAGFQFSADEYVRKPCSPHELRARVREVLSRRAPAA